MEANEIAAFALLGVAVLGCLALWIIMGLAICGVI